ncbi:hypothetical protein Rumeso_01862 [Rubellimicrobium mesophilum DSM 19309]|uniref:Peptidoglycan binding domain-containing protein n=1 Tax=Rubellimicrobium mesophilum DSM 19309 TaxID=442562 RepID=A0A017HQ36_9RHOB|nr:DUF1028 domain-containing protein [Rubellimicrobium mesophilum]EYD76582.1 hypothetical protein Rumeso_01862 [Rubellimicrobium mesophilum DSM 19309]
MAHRVDPVVATFSVVAVDTRTGEAGVAVASKFLAVGSIVPWVAADVGAVATQALANATYGPNGLELMREGKSAEEALQQLTGADPGAERRQVGLVDFQGRAASHTGPGCQPWAGHRVGAGYACQGNMLAGPQVLEAMAKAFDVGSGKLEDRLFAALAAGDEAGGDRRGRQSAALIVRRKAGGYQGLSDTLIDLRVDDAPDPIAELRRLMDLNRLYFPGSEHRDTLPIEGEVLAELTGMVERADLFGNGRPATIWEAIDALVGAENLEERVDVKAKRIDKIALEHLRTVKRH